MIGERATSRVCELAICVELYLFDVQMWWEWRLKNQSIIMYMCHNVCCAEDPTDLRRSVLRTRFHLEDVRGIEIYWGIIEQLGCFRVMTPLIFGISMFVANNKLFLPDQIKLKSVIQYWLPTRSLGLPSLQNHDSFLVVAINVYNQAVALIQSSYMHMMTSNCLTNSSLCSFSTKANTSCRVIVCLGDAGPETLVLSHLSGFELIFMLFVIHLDNVIEEVLREQGLE